jgi:hypothetical protein
MPETVDKDRGNVLLPIHMETEKKGGGYSVARVG